MPVPSDVIEISDTDDEVVDAHPLPPPSSQYSQKSFNSDLVDLCSSDDELPVPGDPKFFRGLGSQAKRKRGSSRPASSGSSAVGYAGDSTDEDESPGKVSRNSRTPLFLGESSDEEDSPRRKFVRKSDASKIASFAGESTDEEKSPQRKVVRKKSAASVKAPRKPRKTAEEQAAAKELKEREAAQKKAQKALEKEQKAVEKERKAAQIAREKEEKKQYKAANKLVGDKKATLKDMELVFPPSLADSPLHRAFVEHVAQYEMPVSVADGNFVRRYDVFSWRRTTNKEYDPLAREWLPVAPYVRVEDMYLVYMTADELARCIQQEDGVKNVVRQVRAVCPGQIFLMISGLALYLKRKGGIRYSMAEIERAVAALQMAEHTHLLYVNSVADAVTRLYDLSADLGIKPYKLIERAHLPLCADTQMKTGAGFADTWVKMLEQVHRLTPSAARGIAEAYPNASALFKAYEGAPTGKAREELLAGCRVKHRTDGVERPRPLGSALSQVVGTVMYGTDPLQLVAKAAPGRG
ncbi:hypothetical protein B0H17DRAFT_1066351 [Mycena rosella]|uniref:ERCC4 domain-containing protein n=1 Tax=Mycena rosella TaxID=1033263 RepID=A0AAD7DE90_MYCRO|nr:hypothetical protein B0H17DRAFT_1066351 [Mycena rosella]